MKKIQIIRHAKSSWKYDLVDHQRPLKKRGKSDVKLVAKHLKNNIIKPDLILSSDAVRAKQTASIFIKKTRLKIVDFELNNALYDFSGDSLIEVIKSTQNSVNILMLFGHNYALTNFVNSYGNLVIDNVPTSGFVEIDFDINSWKNLNRGKTVRRVFPKDLKD
ncbi:SixA phosphatase family protein [Lacinutrix salivirga]